MTKIVHCLPQPAQTLTFADLAVGMVFTITDNGAHPRTFVKLPEKGTYSNATRCISEYAFGDGNFNPDFTSFKVVTKVEFHYD